jgi:hypothetical protein
MSFNFTWSGGLAATTSGLQWISLTPNSGTTTNIEAAVFGSGFDSLSSGENTVSFRLSDGGTNNFDATTTELNSDTNIVLFWAGYSMPAGVYQLQFTTDGGGTWNDTGLTFTVTD